MTEKDRVFWPTKKGLFNPTLPLAFNLLIGVKASNFTGSSRPRLCQNVKIQILVGILDQLLPELHAEVVVIIMNLPYF